MRSLAVTLNVPDLRPGWVVLMRRSSNGSGSSCELPEVMLARVSVRTKQHVWQALDHACEGRVSTSGTVSSAQPQRGQRVNGVDLLGECCGAYDSAWFNVVADDGRHLCRTR